ncbi:MAG TPA: sulfotransferase [Acidimicrobiia bacterium]|nr:sulfotransferase [Acidimicrobiia bacterium]
MSDPLPLRVVGAGLGRTGTHSLKLALERLLDAPCYHMLEVVAHPEDVPRWRDAIAGTPRWDEIYAGYGAAVDWPTAAFWRELMDAAPDAVVLLSLRDAEDWWTSASHTIFESMQKTDLDLVADFGGMVTTLLTERFTPGWADRTEAIAAYERHNDAVRAAVPSRRLVEWRPGDGWAPLCQALDVAVPDEPFPHVNTREEFRAMTGLDG